LITRYAPTVLFLVALVAAWDVAVRVYDLQPYLLPSPGRVWHAFLEVRGTLPEHIRTTMTEALVGLVQTPGRRYSLSPDGTLGVPLGPDPERVLVEVRDVVTTLEDLASRARAAAEAAAAMGAS